MYVIRSADELVFSSSSFLIGVLITYVVIVLLVFFIFTCACCGCDDEETKKPGGKPKETSKERVQEKPDVPVPTTQSTSHESGLSAPPEQLQPSTVIEANVSAAPNANAMPSLKLMTPLKELRTTVPPSDVTQIGGQLGPYDIRSAEAPSLQLTTKRSAPPVRKPK